MTHIPTSGDDAHNKYKMFRNYMTNELGITRGDIEAWTKESVAAEVRKLVGQINIPDRVRTEIMTNVRRVIIPGPFNNRISDEVQTAIRQAITAEIAGRIIFTNPEPPEVTP